MLPPPTRTAVRAPLQVRAALHQRRQRRRAGALGQRLLAFEQHQDGGGDLLFVDGDDLVDVPRDHRQREFAGAAHGDAVGDGGRSVDRHGMMLASTARAIDGKRAVCTPMMRTLGRVSLIAQAMPLMSPPPPMGTTTASRSGPARAARGRWCPARP